LSSFPKAERAVKPDAATPLHDRVEQLFLEARSDLYYYVLSFGLKAHEAQEIVQDVFLRFYVALKQGDVIENSRGWIFRVGHNLAVNALRRPVTSRLFVVESDRFAAPGEISPEAALMRKEAAGKIRQTLAALSPQQRLCLQLRAEGLRYAEIANAAGIGVSTVGKFLSRAIRKLRKAVQE
jgi:RNA polymerase sigma-70 factor, ECF subfamily